MWAIEDSPIGRIVVAPGGAALFYTTRDFHGRLDPASTRKLTRVIEERFGIRATLTTCNQVHGATVTRATREQQWRECDSCDALYSGEAAVALGIKVADCLPVTMIDSAHSVIANIHSGWRGAVQQITAATLDEIERETPFDLKTAAAYLGPSIRSCCFEVGEEVADRFEARYLDRTHAKPHVDLVAFTMDILRARGFSGDRLFDSGLCTRCDGSIFHSFRRDGTGGGRNLALVAQ